jgi:hypothetical protein
MGSRFTRTVVSMSTWGPFITYVVDTLVRGVWSKPTIFQDD